MTETEIGDDPTGDRPTGSVTVGLTRRKEDPHGTTRSRLHPLDELRVGIGVQVTPPWGRPVMNIVRLPDGLTIVVNPSYGDRWYTSPEIRQPVRRIPLGRGANTRRYADAQKDKEGR